MLPGRCGASPKMYGGEARWGASGMARSQLFVSQWTPSLPGLPHHMGLFLCTHGDPVKRCKRVTYGLSSGNPRVAESTRNITGSLMESWRSDGLPSDQSIIEGNDSINRTMELKITPKISEDASASLRLLSVSSADLYPDKSLVCSDERMPAD